MKICIFGADGRTGTEVVNYAKNKGYDVTAFVYRKKTTRGLSQDIKIVQGNILNYEDVYNVLKDTDVVISTVGHIKNSDPLMQTKGITNIIKAMQELQIKRVISLTGTGVRINGDKPSILDKILNIAVKIIDPNRVTDGVEHAKVMQNSNLEWTIVRVLKLNQSEKEPGDYRLTEHGPAEFPTNRKKVAKVLVDLIQDKNFIQKMPIISKFI